jgi:hypothetical protein
LFKALQGFADRPLAGTHLLGDFKFNQTGGGLKLAEDDFFAQG